MDVSKVKKKCRRCNFRRYCHLYPLNCIALNRNCFTCNKRGHFPQSQNCKATRKKKYQVKYPCLKPEKKTAVLETNPGISVGCNKLIMKTPKFIPNPKLLKLIENRIEVIEKVYILEILNWWIFTNQHS